MKSTLVIFPNQLFKAHAGLTKEVNQIELVEDTLFFKDERYPLNLHKQKLLLHRASMRAYADNLKNRGFSVRYRDWQPGILKSTLEQYRGTRIVVMNPVDYTLSERLEKLATQLKLDMHVLPSQLFINTDEENHAYRSDRKRWFMADYYKQQRLKLNILITDGKPEGDKWSFDTDNRKKIPKSMYRAIPSLPLPRSNKWTREAQQYVNTTFPSAQGKMDTVYYPVTFNDAEKWLSDFLTERFACFGSYEDALVPEKSWLFHSVLTPMLNIGLLTPQQVIEAALDHASKTDIPINSLEGFIRQIIGWREFMRATYEDLGVKMRNGNHWKHHRQIPESFYTGNTGILPVDDVTQRVLETGYCHHIERLMVLGGFMFLCEFEPDAIYRWFMELFVDAYDWVMVPNVYAMSQNADGGLITTKPYFSGSSYLRKMGYDSKGEWREIWDGLYWRWVFLHSDSLSKNPRWAMMCSMARKMDKTKMKNHIAKAEHFLSRM